MIGIRTAVVLQSYLYLDCWLLRGSFYVLPRHTHPSGMAQGWDQRFSLRWPLPSPSGSEAALAQPSLGTFGGSRGSSCPGASLPRQGLTPTYVARHQQRFNALLQPCMLFNTLQRPATTQSDPPQPHQPARCSTMQWADVYVYARIRVCIFPCMRSIGDAFACT